MDKREVNEIKRICLEVIQLQEWGNEEHISSLRDDGTTVVDLEKIVTNFLLERLKKLDFKVSILCEDCDNSINMDSGRFLVADIIDGTDNFLYDLGPYASSFAYVCNGKTWFSFIYDHINKRKYEATIFERKKHVYTSKLSEQNRFLSISSLHKIYQSDFSDHIEMFIKNSNCPVYIRRCNAIDFMEIYNGKISGRIKLSSPPWDHIASVFFLQMNGIETISLNGGEYSLSSKNMLTAVPWLIKAWKALSGYE